MAGQPTLARRLANAPVDAETARVIAEARAASRPEVDMGNLPDSVAGPEERRCPFLTIWSGTDKEGQPKDDGGFVDAVCDTRIQTFHDSPPFGPRDLKVCELCLQARQYQLAEGQAETAEEYVEEMKDAAKAAPPSKDNRHYG